MVSFSVEPNRNQTEEMNKNIGPVSIRCNISKVSSPTMHGNYCRMSRIWNQVASKYELVVERYIPVGFGSTNQVRNQTEPVSANREPDLVNRNRTKLKQNRL